MEVPHAGVVGVVRAALNKPTGERAWLGGNRLPRPQLCTMAPRNCKSFCPTPCVRLRLTPSRANHGFPLTASPLLTTA